MALWAHSRGTPDCRRPPYRKRQRSSLCPQPYLCRAWSSGGTDVTGNETVQSLISAVRTLSIDKCVDYKPSAEAVSLCGFDAPAAAVTVIYRDDTDAEQTLTLTVGAAASDGASRYVRINDDSTVYAMSADSLSAVLTVAAGGLSA